MADAGGREVLLALAERCQAAVGADRELDAAIGVTIGRLVAVHFNGRPCWAEVNPAGGLSYPGQAPDMLVPDYTASLDAALTLVPEGWDWSAHLRNTPLGPRTAEGTANNGELFMSGRRVAADVWGYTPALALVAAALRARAAQDHPVTILPGHDAGEGRDG